MNLMSRLFAETRDRRRLRAARAEIRRGEAIRHKRQRNNPGYDELRCPYFIGVMVLAVAVLFFDLRSDWSVLGDWLDAASSLFSSTQEVPRV